MNILRLFSDAKHKKEFTDKELHTAFNNAISKEFNKQMKIDVVIGNPPYNETDDTGSSKPINTYFVRLGIMMNTKYMAYIMPDRWFVSPDQLNKDCRISLIGKIKYMRDFDDTDVVFSGTSIRGGVSYFLYDKDYDGEMIYEDNRGSINVKHNEKFLCKSVASNILFNHVKANSKEYMDADYISTSFFGLTRNASGNVIQTHGYDITLKSSGDDTYLTLDDVPRHKEFVSKYKVAIPYSAMNPKPFIMMPNEICTLTYLIVRFFNTQTEAENCKKYLETNFFKTLFNGLKTKLGSTKENFMCIPLQDFTVTSNIDWSKSLHDIDIQLYQYYGLSNSEITQIENQFNHSVNNQIPKGIKFTAEDVQANYINQMINNQ